MKTFWMGLLSMVLLLGIGSLPAMSLEPSDGGLSEEDQDAEFDDPGAFDEVDEFADLSDVHIDEDADAPVDVRKLRVVGVWQYTGKDKGWFAGKLYVKKDGKRILWGRIKGVFEKSLLGRRELAGVVLNRNGKYRGTVKGEYGRHKIRAVWDRLGARKNGHLRAEFRVPFGRAGFVGKLKAPKLVVPDENEDENTEETPSES